MINATCDDIKPTTSPMKVVVAQGNTMTSTHEGILPIPGLPPEARKAHLFHELSQGSGSLVSLGQLCDSGCTATFTATTVQVHHKNKCILTGYRTTVTGLWHIPLTPPPGFPQTPINNKPSHSANAAAHFDPTKAQQVAFSHAALGSPVLSTLQQALENNYITGFPGLTSKAL